MLLTLPRRVGMGPSLRWGDVKAFFVAILLLIAAPAFARIAARALPIKR